jgi:hypothetical protein
MADHIEHLCEVMHNAYEDAAVDAGWETQQASRKPWSDVPEANKITMRAAVIALLDELHVELSEWQCPACGAITRARMSDHDKES